MPFHVVFEVLNIFLKLNFRQSSTTRLKLSFSLTKHIAAACKNTLVQIWKVSKVLKSQIGTFSHHLQMHHKTVSPHQVRYFRQGLYELRVLSATGILANLLEAAGHCQRLEQHYRQASWGFADQLGPMRDEQDEMRNFFHLVRGACNTNNTAYSQLHQSYMCRTNRYLWSSGISITLHLICCRISQIAADSSRMQLLLK